MHINDETLRLWLIESGDRKKVRKGRQHRQWRERKHYFGEVIQLDDSHYDCFEDRGAKCALKGFIDDAMSKVVARFHEYRVGKDMWSPGIIIHGVELNQKNRT